MSRRSDRGPLSTRWSLWWRWGISQREPVEPRGQQAGVPSPKPRNSILGHELGERQARATGAQEAPPRPPLLLLDDGGGASLLLSRTRCRVLHGASEMRRGDFVQVLVPKWTHTHIHDPLEDLHSCEKGTPPLPDVAAALCEVHSNTHRWRAAHQAAQEK